MYVKSQLTNEKLKKSFKNDFELADYAINAAEHLVRSGKEFSLVPFLSDIAANPHKYDAEQNIKEEPKEEEGDGE